MAEFEYAEIEVEGKKIKDWLKSDEGLVDYKKCEQEQDAWMIGPLIFYETSGFLFTRHSAMQSWLNRYSTGLLNRHSKRVLGSGGAC